MFKNFYNKITDATVFEKLLLLIGLGISLVGFWLINYVYTSEPGINWNSTSALFLWLILLFLVILTDSNESIKEELSVLIKENTEEIKLLKEEIKLLRMPKKGK